MRVLVLDDDVTCSQFLTLLLEDEGYDVRSANSAQEALNLADVFNPQVLIADWLLKDGMDGADVAHRLRSRDEKLQILFTTGSPAEQLANQLGDLPGSHIFEKPIAIDSLLDRLKDIALSN